MNFSSTGLLKFEELKELLAHYAGSVAGRTLVYELEPHGDRAALEADLADAGEAIAYLREVSGGQETSRGAAVRLRFDQLRDIDNSLRTLQVEGAGLSGREIMDLFHTLAVAGEHRGILLGVSDRYPRLARRAHDLAD